MDRRALVDSALKYLAGLAIVPDVHRPSSTRHGLSQREFEVLQLLSAGKSNAEIAAELYISPRTVPHHTKGIFNKLGVGSRTAAVAEARRRGIV